MMAMACSAAKARQEKTGPGGGGTGAAGSVTAGIGMVVRGSGLGGGMTGAVVTGSLTGGGAPVTNSLADTFGMTSLMGGFAAGASAAPTEADWFLAAVPRSQGARMDS